MSLPLNADEKELVRNGQRDIALFKWRLRNSGGMKISTVPENWQGLLEDSEIRLVARQSISPKLREIADMARWITKARDYENEGNRLAARDCYNHAKHALGNYVGMLNKMPSKSGDHAEIADTLYEIAVEGLKN